MPELIIASLVIFAIFGIPIITGLFGRGMGPSFWFWFLAGCVLPLISGLILFLLPDLTTEKTKGQI